MTAYHTSKANADPVVTLAKHMERDSERAQKNTEVLTDIVKTVIKSNNNTNSKRHHDDISRGEDDDDDINNKMLLWN
jgi:hypothetical protein